MKKRTKKILIGSGIGLFIFAILAVGIVSLIQSRHYPYVATIEEGMLIYNNEPYLPIDRQEAEDIIGAKVELGEVLGEIKFDFGLSDYIMTNYPILTIKGDQNINFIVQPMWQSPTAIYCRKEFYDTLNKDGNQKK